MTTAISKISFYNTKRLTLSLMLLTVLCLTFWLSSRVPALNEKAMMGGSASLTSLSFDILYEPDDSAPIYKQIIVNAVNWVYTNRQGMTFGVLLASVLMTLLPLLNTGVIRSKLANSTMGMLVGSSLGVCVNCAAPIAQGMAKSGAQRETALATMVSSPTLNFIVLSMVFALFPFYLAVLKVTLTVFVMLVIIPLLVRFFPSGDKNESFENNQVCSIADSPFAAHLPQKSEASWITALRWIVVTAARNLFYIIKVAVPLMLLAGILGAVLITLAPLDKLVDILPVTGRIQIIASMLGLALFCIFLPVPMAFDVIVSAVLLAAGMPVMYVAVVLFCLGIYSVYGYFIASRISSLGTASALFICLSFMGVIAGVTANELGDRAVLKDNILLSQEAVSGNADRQPSVLRYTVDTPNTSVNLLSTPVKSRYKAYVQPGTDIQGEALSVEIMPFETRSANAGQNLFTAIPGKNIGLDVPFSFEITQALLMRFRSISSGDVNADGWADLLVSDSHGLHLYTNDNGIEFRKQTVNLPLFENQYITNAVLVDLNNDTQLDMFVATYHSGNYIAYNNNGDFGEANMVKLPSHPDILRTVSSAFGDIDRDGDLDIVLGSWSMGSIANKLSLPSSRNIWLRQTNDGFEMVPLDAKFGETLSTLLSDINNDGLLDLFVGNDFDVPDAFYFGTESGGFEQMRAVPGDGLRSTVTTMSITSADINNDLVPELLMSQITEMPGGAPKIRKIGPGLCSTIPAGEDRAACEQIQGVLKPVVSAVNRASMAECYQRVPEDFQADCIALLTLFTGTFTASDAQRCAQMPKNWSELDTLCQRYHQFESTHRYSLESGDIPNSKRFNVLLERNQQGAFENVAKQKGLDLTGWAWNSKFADLDNDGWQDLYVTNGQMGLLSAYSNILFKNKGNGEFAYDANSGLESFLDSGAYTYFDFDNDGDLDIAVLPQSGPLLFYKNSAQKNSIAFEFADSLGNRSGIGNKLTIHYGSDGEKHQMRELQAGGGFISFDAPRLAFGLDEHTEITRIDVDWSTGEKSTIEGIFPAGNLYRLVR